MIWDNLKHGFTVLAPMEGVTDSVFRAVIEKAGRPDLFFTEFTNVSSFASEKGRHDALERLTINSTDAPIIAQIWGKNPEHFALLASKLESLGFSGLDLNMGCPDKHVNKAGGGAAMIKTPDLASECIKQARENTNLPVSVKTRLGFTYIDEYKEWLPFLLNHHLAALTVHLRTRKEMSKVNAHFELIPEIIKLKNEISPETKLIINGDIKDIKHAHELSEKYPEIDGFMIGRGVFNNPFCFNEKYINKTPSLEELLNLFRFHLDLYDKRNEELKLEHSKNNLKSSHSGKIKGYPFEPLKHFYKVYINSFDGASDLRVKLMDCKNTTELRKVLDIFEK